MAEFDEKLVVRGGIGKWVGGSGKNPRDTIERTLPSSYTAEGGFRFRVVEGTRVGGGCGAAGDMPRSPKIQQRCPLERVPEDQPNSLGSGPTSCTSRGGSGFWLTSGKSPGTGPVHPPSQNAFHSPSCPISGENRRRPSAVRSHSASATLDRVAAT